MTDLQFQNLAEALLETIERNCDAMNDTSDIDIDNQRIGNMLTLTFTNASQIIVNLQKPLHEVWLAAKAGGFHFQFDGTHWRNTKGHEEFFDLLSKLCSEQAHQTLVFK